MARMLDLSRSWKFFAGFLLLAFVAFWPTYLSQPATLSGYTHFHAAAATSWMALLILQSWAIGSHRVALHRFFGKWSYALAPLLVLSVILLAHEPHRRHLGRGLLDPDLRPLSAGLAGPAVRAFLRPRDLEPPLGRAPFALHGLHRFDPGRPGADPHHLLDRTGRRTFNYQWLTFGVTDLILLVLIVLERSNRAGRGVFPAMLAVFVAFQAPALLGWTDGPLWQAFARWFANI